jgi:uncharacterized protein (TIGR02271 family)
LINQETEKQHTGNEPTDQSLKIQVLEEHLKVTVKEVETGRVRITKHVTEHTEDLNIPLVSEEVDIEKVAVNQYVETAPGVRYEGETMIIPVIREVLVVEKKLMLVEELRVTKRQVQTNETQQVTLRKEEVDIERLGPGNATENNF